MNKDRSFWCLCPSLKLTIINDHHQTFFLQLSYLEKSTSPSPCELQHAGLCYGTMVSPPRFELETSSTLSIKYLVWKAFDQ